MNFFLNYVKVQRMLGETPMHLFRRFVMRILYLTTFVGFSILAIPSLYAAWYFDEMGVFYYNIFVFSSFAFVFFNKKLSYPFKFWYLSLIIFISGIAMTAQLGYKASGFDLLFAFPFLMIILGGRKKYFLSMAMNVLGLFIITILHFSLNIPLKGLLTTNFTEWAVKCINFLAINLVFSLPVVFLVTYIEKSFKTKDDLIKSIKLQRNNLLKTNESMDKYIYSLSHDVRGPLSNILGLINVIEITKDDKEKSQLETQLKTSAEQLDEMLKSLIIFYQGRKLRIQNESFDLKVFIQSTIGRLDAVKKYPHHQININCSDDLIVHADKYRFKVALINVLDNALKFSSKREKIKIEIKLEIKENKDIEISISDNGIGIDEANSSSLFNLFHKGHDQSFEGHGIGLYLAKLAIEEVNGKIKLKNNSNVGCCAQLILKQENPRPDDMDEMEGLGT